MAKVAFTKLKLKVNDTVTNVTLSDDIVIEVKNYLPMDDKIALITEVVNNALDEATGCFSPIRIEVYFTLCLVKYYTNLNFTEKQFADAGKTYDLLESNCIMDKIIDVIPEDEFNYLRNSLEETCKDIAAYNNSFAGMIKGISNNTESLNGQFADIFEKIKDREGLELLDSIKQIVG